MVTQESLKSKRQKTRKGTTYKCSIIYSCCFGLAWPKGPWFLKGLGLSFLNLATFDLETVAYSKGNILTLGTSCIAQKRVNFCRCGP